MGCFSGLPHHAGVFFWCSSTTDFFHFINGQLRCYRSQLLYALSFWSLLLCLLRGFSASTWLFNFCGPWGSAFLIIFPLWSAFCSRAHAPMACSLFCVLGSLTSACLQNMESSYFPQIHVCHDFSSIYSMHSSHAACPTPDPS